MHWSPQSPDLTPFDFFFWLFLTDTLFVPAIDAKFLIFANLSPLLWLWSNVIC